MSKKSEPLAVEDPSGLTDADWIEINRLKRVYESGGQKALSKALAEMGSDPVRYMRVMAALFPNEVRNAIKDEMAELGLDENDIRELVRKMESPAGKQ